MNHAHPAFRLTSSLSWLLLLLLLILLSGCGQDRDSVLELRGATMGTFYSVKLIALPPTLTAEALQQRIDAELERVNDLMSTYRPDSALSRFNASRSTDWFASEPEVVALIAKAQRIHERSAGAFDVTVGPLVNLWGFGPEFQSFRVPDAAAIAHARERVGSDRLTTRADPPALRKTHPELFVDLSGIAKGYGVDRIAAILDEVGATAYLVEIGGELRAKGRKPGERPWRVAIERPQTDGRGIDRIVALEDAAMATSGDYRNFHREDGQIYSHTIDPTTGRPVEHELASVTVISEDCANADAWATALLVLGPEQGFAIAESEGLAAFFIRRDDDQFTHRATSMFDARTTGP
ncbi:FAD:protein FMN transferase ApbE [Thiocapsa imhoffii]|uniref:FAD:protein FMN transferase n=1 Tax=Thiocapsa imhoffii TaxID=382777 RepID=A0A9X0WKT1_9GAMM|nr:FAD:protein FMN transferase [Thiocapsa imhoffii]MBK1646561.1 FAD:protein FMN transferase ApbE [Thiocapsa imhoffii]